ncbi:MAG: putative sulfite exporter TauE/SafE [Streblomastix strix]|uniref:Putative sulfite exporter TauE/SafE n=1 Tax=Streblomastix strix TaxID=222440 RepID=A0A5J4WJF0_9EUKA|nr:MAG: putative sulfite exporter TauE/SafE [Streblomastix strix]
MIVQVLILTFVVSSGSCCSARNANGTTNHSSILNADTQRTCNHGIVDFVCQGSQGCVDGLCGVCRSDADCGAQSTCKGSQCIHKGIWPPTWQTFISMIGGFAISILGGATGLGGGSFVVPVMSLVSFFKSSVGVAIAQVTIFGNGIMSFIMGMYGRHPNRDRPRIYCDIVVVMIPCLLAGSFIGVYLAQIVPQYVITVLLCLFLILTLYRSFKKAVVEFRKEQQIRKEAKQAALSTFQGIKVGLSADKESQKGSSQITKYESPSFPDHADPQLSNESINIDQQEHQHVVEESKEMDELTSEMESLHKKEGNEIYKSGSVGPIKPSPLITQFENMPEFSVLSPPQTPTNEFDIPTSLKTLGETLVPTKQKAPQPPDSIINEHSLNTDNISPELAQMYKSERRLSIKKTIFCVIMWIVLLLVSLARGGKSGKSIIGILKCSAGDWVIIVLYLIFTGCMTCVGSFLTLKEQRKKDALGYQFAEGDVRWTLRSSILYPFICTAAGVLAGLLGIGGALITNPILLEMGVLIPVVTATTSALLLTTSSSSSLQFAVGGMLPWDWGIVFFILGLGGALLGTAVVARIAIKKKRYSVLLFLIGTLFSVSLVISGFHGLFTIILLASHRGYMGFSSPCN